MITNKFDINNTNQLSNNNYNNNSTNNKIKDEDKKCSAAANCCFNTLATCFAGILGGVLIYATASIWPMDSSSITIPEPELDADLDIPSDVYLVAGTVFAAAAIFFSIRYTLNPQQIKND